MSADKFAGRARRLAVAALAATEYGLSTGIKHRPPSDHPDIREAERAGWIRRTSKRFGGFRSDRARVTVFEITNKGREALARYGAPTNPTIAGPGPSAKRRRKEEECWAAKKAATAAITSAMISNMLADPRTPPATRVRLNHIAAARATRAARSERQRQ